MGRDFRHGTIQASNAVVDDFIGGVWARQTRRRLPHQYESTGRCDEFGDGLGKSRQIEGACFETTGGADRFQRPRIGRLMIVRGEGVGEAAERINGVDDVDRDVDATVRAGGSHVERRGPRRARA